MNRDKNLGNLAATFSPTLSQSWGSEVSKKVDSMGFNVSHGIKMHLACETNSNTEQEEVYNILKE